MLGTDLIRVLLLAILGESRHGKDTERQNSTEQPHGWLEEKEETRTRGAVQRSLATAGVGYKYGGERKNCGRQPTPLRPRTDVS